MCFDRHSQSLYDINCYSSWNDSTRRNRFSFEIARSCVSWPLIKFNKQNPSNVKTQYRIKVWLVETKNTYNDTTFRIQTDVRGHRYKITLVLQYNHKLRLSILCGVSFWAFDFATRLLASVDKRTKPSDINFTF